MSSRFQQAETAGKAPLGAVIPKMAGRFHGVKPGRHSWVRRKAIINGRKSRRTFSDLFLSFTKEKTSTSSASAAAQMERAAVLRGLAK